MKRSDGSPSAPRRRGWYLLLLVPFVVLSAVPFFNRIEPRVWGIPFFWWFQLSWIPISAGLTAFVYFRTEHNGNEGDVG